MRHAEQAGQVSNQPARLMAEQVLEQQPGVGGGG
jgi:hypothetical protein